MAALQHNYRDDPASGSGASSAVLAFELSHHRLPETPARTLRLLLVNPGPDVSTAAVAVLADLSAIEAHRILAGLAQANLVETTPGSEGHWRVNDLVRSCAQKLSDAYAETDGREQARDRLLGYYLGMADAADRYLRMLPGRIATAEFTSRDDALAWLDAEQASLTAAVQMAADTGRDRDAVSLPLLLAEYLAWRRRFDDLLATTTVSLNVARRLGDRRREGYALTNLGGALLEMCRFDEAITTHQEAIAIYRETGNRHGEGNALNNLGLALRESGRLEDAIAAHQEAIAIYRETGDRYREGMALENLRKARNAQLA